MKDQQADRVLIVDDDEAVGMVLQGLLTQAGLKADHVLDARAALDRVGDGGYDLVLTDLRMDGMDGMALLRKLHEQLPYLPVVMLTAHGSVETAVEAMKAGAADFLTKPFQAPHVVETVNRAIGLAAPRAQQPPSTPTGDRPVLGRSPAMLEVQEVIRRAASTASTILLRGETGSGKEVAARSIHEQSPRRGKPFVAIHCAALPESLLESELFGNEEGAYTGAKRRPGRVELAEGGTLFLDEIGDISAAVQIKLLRILQEKTYHRLGGRHEKTADVRFIAATNRDLETMVEQGEFREDLFYRLNVLPIQLPPLRERREDIEDLANSFCLKLAHDNARPELRLEAEATELLSQQDWPGNVRQLANFIERLVVFSDDDRISAADVERELERAHPAPSKRRPPADDDDLPNSGSLAEHRLEAEKEAIVDALDRAGGNKSKAARLLGVARRTLYNRMEALGLL